MSATAGGHGGEVLLRDKVESTTDPDARLFKKATPDKSVPSYQGHVIMEKRSGLVGAEVSQSATHAEREVALDLLDQVLVPVPERDPEQKVTLGADTQYQDEKFIEVLRHREAAPRVSEYVKGNLGKKSLNETEEPVYAFQSAHLHLAQRSVELGSAKDPLDQHYNLVRMRRLIPVPA